MGYNRRGDGIASYPVCAYTDKDGKSTKHGTFVLNPAGSNRESVWQPYFIENKNHGRYKWYFRSVD